MIDLQQLNSNDYKEYGRKAANLGEAINKGLLVPKGFALSYQDFGEFLIHNSIQYIPTQYISEGPEIQARILEGTFSETFHEELDHRITKMQQKSGCHSFVVRSSASIEDAGNNSMAGMFESYLKLSTLDEIEVAIRKCYCTLYSDKVLNYAFMNQGSLSEWKMGVLIQEYIEGDNFGVMFTADPLSGQEDMIQLSMYEGDSASLQRMAADTKIFSLNKNTGLLIEMPSCQLTTLRNKGLPQKLLDLAINCEAIFGLAMDIEWTSREDSLFLLQARPITTLKREVLCPVWTEVGQEEYEWFRLYPKPLKPLMQDIIMAELREQSKASYETMFRTDTYAEGIIQKGYLYVRSIPITEEATKRKEYMAYLEELAEKGSCIFHDLHLPNLIAYRMRLNDFLNRRLTWDETEQFLKLSMEYHNYCVRNHWPMVQANEFLYRFERDILECNHDLVLSDFYDLISGYTLQTRDRELLFQMSDVVISSPKLKMMFEECPYDAILYERLLHSDEAERLLELTDQYLEEFGVCDSYESEELLPVILERPDYILGYLRRVLDLDSREFYANLDSAKEKKDKVLKQLCNRLNNKEREEFLHKLKLAEKAFLTNDNHNYYVERLFRGYLRLAVRATGRLLYDEKILKDQEDIQYLYYDEILSLLKEKTMDERLIQRRKTEIEFQNKLEAPELLSSDMSEGEKTESMEQFTQKLKNKNSTEQFDEPPMYLKGVSGLKKRVRGKVYVGIPNIPQEAILVMPHCHYGDIMPVISKVKGLIFLWGSPYDHPAIVARELGIPAMYYVDGAMELLKNGDEVEIDGYEGLIHIISRADASKMI
jgi:pyruvate,water dikinase